MILINQHTGGLFKIIYDEEHFNRSAFTETEETLLTIVWNRGQAQQLSIDGTNHTCLSNGMVAFMANQTFEFEVPKDIVAWQFNRQFYCIVDHDKEVSCAGLLFYGSMEQPIIELNAVEARKIDLLYQVFVDEFEDKDSLQEDMLRILLKRLIIKITRLYKQQANLSRIPTEELDVVRQYNLLVEKNFKEWHQVQDYANKMNKSPKTLSNLFAQYNAKSPLKIIHERVILEAKRLLIYTDFSVKEIAFEIGFEEVPPFNRLFKKITNSTPTKFRNSILRTSD